MSGGDAEQVVGADHVASFLEVGPNLRVMERSVLTELHRLDVGQECAQGSRILSALPGRDLYLFLDDKPLSQTMPDDAGNWSVESEMELEDGRHTFRADQYDATTQMLAARAMITFERAKQPPQGDNAGSGEPPTAKASTP